VNKKQIIILILAVVAFVVCILVNFRGFISLCFSNAATATEMIDLRPLLAELVILVIIFGVLFMKFKTPNKKD
jgi:membrane-bound acyltransferase YfiQ involved in biofilm formation